VRESNLPIYVIDLGRLLAHEVALQSSSIPYVRLNRKRADSALKEIAKASGGRLYEPESTLDLPAIYDDLMQTLRARYVITYHSQSARPAPGPREVRVELIDRTTGRPLTLADAKGHPIHANALIAGTLVPSRAEEVGKG
jgi:hypothetical protein